MKNQTVFSDLSGKKKESKCLFLKMACMLVFMHSGFLFAQTFHPATPQMLQLRQLNSFNKASNFNKNGAGSLSVPFAVQQADAGTNPLSQIIQSLAGPGITITNVQTTLPATSNIYGSFTGGTNVIGIENGLIMTSGSVLNALGPNISSSSSQDNGLPGYFAIDTAGFDAAVITFNVSSTTSFLSFKYVFASEEYNEYVGTQFNDVFAFLISGPGIAPGTNIALIPGTNIPVSINDVNLGLNSQFYINNDSAANADPFRFQNLEYDGLTQVLATSPINVVPNAVYTITLIIQDVADPVYDSGVFIQGGSITSDTCLLNVVATKHNVTCNGAGNGYVDLTYNGAVGSVQFAWSNGATTKDINNLIPGTYNVIVTDSKGCTAHLAAPAIITQPSALKIGQPIIHNPNCGGGAAGAVNINPSGGTTPYTYLWNDGNTQEDRTNLSSGTYTVTVTDANNCSKHLTITLTASLNATVKRYQPISCYGSCDGILKVEIINGVPPYSFLWSNGKTTRKNSHLCAGFYSVTVSDASGCTAVQINNVELKEKGKLSLRQIKTEITAPGANDGAVSRDTLSGSRGPYTFLWNDGYAFGNRTNIAPGHYTITITDANGCTAVVNKKWKDPVLRYGTELVNYSLDVYPNPSEAAFNVEIDAQVAEHYLINVVDLQGRIVSTQNYNLTAGLHHFSFDLSDHPKGIYMLSISTLDSKSIQKLILK